MNMTISRGRLTTDPEVLKPLLFLRQREIVHYARFKELLEHYKNK